jgi:hypothetical protein
MLPARFAGEHALSWQLTLTSVAQFGASSGAFDRSVGCAHARNVQRAAGNLTGVYFFSNDLVMKRLELLHQLVPRAASIALLVSPNVTTNDQVQDTLDAARVLGMRVGVLKASNEDEIRGLGAEPPDHWHRR